MRKGKKLGDIKDSSGSDLKLCWHRGVPNINFKQEGELLIRIVSDIWEVNRHWITTHKNRKNIYQWCTSFDPIEGSKSPDIPCACCETGIRDDINLAMLVIVRNFQDSNEKDVIRVMLIPKHQFSRLLKLQEKNRSDLNSVKKGCDLFVEFNPKEKQNKWTIDREDRTALTPAEKKLVEAFPTLDELIPDFSEEAELIPYYDQAKNFLAQNMYFVRQSKSYVDPDSPWVSFKGEVGGTPWFEFTELVAYEQESYVDTRNRKGGCPQTEADREAYFGKKDGKKGRRKLKIGNSTDSDMDEAFGAEKEAPKKRRKKKAAPTRTKKKATPTPTTKKKKKKKKVKNPECFGDYDGSEDCLNCSASKRCRVEDL